MREDMGAMFAICTVQSSIVMMIPLLHLIRHRCFRGRDYLLIELILPPLERQSGVGQLGHCTWVRLTLHLQPSFFDQSGPKPTGEIR